MLRKIGLRSTVFGWVKKSKSTKSTKIYEIQYLYRPIVSAVNFVTAYVGFT